MTTSSNLPNWLMPVISAATALVVSLITTQINLARLDEKVTSLGNDRYYGVEGRAAERRITALEQLDSASRLSTHEADIRSIKQRLNRLEQHKKTEMRSSSP